MLTKEYQEHNGAKDANTWYVGYNYDESASGGEFTKGLRPTSIRYADGRLVEDKDMHFCAPAGADHHRRSRGRGRGNVLNEIVREYNDLAMLVKEFQEHGGAKDANTPYVGYNYDESAAGGEFDRSEMSPCFPIPSMGGGQMADFLYATGKALRGVGCVVECGSWLGASVAPVAAGLRDAGSTAAIHCYDRWRATKEEVRKAAAQGVELFEGQDLLPLFKENVLAIYPHVVCHQGWTREATWRDDPIELYIDDCNKDPEDFHHALATFGPAWIPGQTIVVLMDFEFLQETAPDGRAAAAIQVPEALRRPPFRQLRATRGQHWRNFGGRVQAHETVDVDVDTAAEAITSRYELLRRLPKRGVVAEIGVFAGDFAAKILEIVRPLQLVLVDWWKPGPVAQGNVRTTGPENYRRVLDRFAAPIARGQVVVVCQDSSDAARQFDDEHFDWIYIDADHSYTGVARDLAAWRTKVKWSGFILGHDYCEPADRDYGVVRAVNDVVARGELELVGVTLEAFPSFIARRAK